MSRLAFGTGTLVGGIEGKYKFDPVPLTEAGADADCFVCEFVAATGANETGVGAGLTGEDLVLTQYGSPGTDGYNRVIAPDTFQSFRCTTACYQSFCQSPVGWSVAYRCKSINGINSASILSLQATQFSGSATADNPKVMQIQAFAGGWGSNAMAVSSNNNAGNGIGGGFTLPQFSTLFPVDGEQYLFVGSLDYVSGLAFSGVAVDLGVFPTKLTDFLTFATNQLEPFGGPPDIGGYAYGDYYKYIVGGLSGYASNYSAGQTVVSLTLAKRPCYVPR